jgi:hypothetical protein
MRHLLSKLSFLLVLLISVLPAADAVAADVGAAQARQMQAVIQAQLDAFAADDAKRAFSFAAPKVREVFGSAERFMAMVRSGYPVVYRPAAVSFFKPQAVDGGFIQRVQLTDESGAVWLATYQLERQRDRSWRISGCEVVPSEGLVA